ncbi:MAG: fumarylacetoacetate hydrolase family protein [Rhizobium sp.]
MTRIINDSGRLKLVLKDGILDVARASDGRFQVDPQAIYAEWDAFVEWASSASRSAEEVLPTGRRVGSPVSAPRQIIGVGLNYHSHVTHSGLKTPTEPGVFAKFFTSLAGPYDEIPLPSELVITEAELAVVIKREAFNISEAEALNHLAGATTAQDLMDPASVVKIPKLDGGPGANYLNPSKSLAAFTPIGPQVVSLDETGDLGNLSIELDINGTPVQRGNTNDLIFAVPELIARLSRKLRLLPGDVILTGSPERLPSAAGLSLKPGDKIRATVQGLGEQLSSAVSVVRAAAA